MFGSKFNPKNDPDKIEIDFIESRVSDHSGIEAIKSITDKYRQFGKQIRLIHLSPECKVLLLKSDPNFGNIIESSIDDPRYHVVTDLMDKEV
jgi:SulP family sulfate permease